MVLLYICISCLMVKKDIVIGIYYGNWGFKFEKDMFGMFVSILFIRMMVDFEVEFLFFVCSVGKEQLFVMWYQKYFYNFFVNELRQVYYDL